MKNKERILSIPMADVLDWLGLELPKRGKIRCPDPDHEDRHPSAGIFTGRDGYDWFKCHACGARGNVINLVRIVLGYDTMDAVRWLEAQAGIPSPFDKNFIPPTPRPKPKYDLFKWKLPKGNLSTATVDMYAYLWAEHDAMVDHWRADRTPWRERQQESAVWWRWANRILEVRQIPNADELREHFTSLTS